VRAGCWARCRCQPLLHRPRTWFFDQLITCAAGDGLGQVVLLAAGMDTRAFRLPLPAATVLYQLDDPAVHAGKQAILDREHAVPCCARRPVAADLAGARWPASLAAAGFDPAALAVFVAEGLTRYLPGQAVTLLLDQAAGIAGLMLGTTGDPGDIAGEARHAERLGFDLAASGEHVFFTARWPAHSSSWPAVTWRYVGETVALLAGRAPKLRQAVRGAKKAGHAYVVLDGTLIPAGRVAADRPFYSGKHKRHGMNLQVIASPDGGILWVSGALPGSVHDKKAEWIWGALAELEAAGLVTLADKGYQGSTYAKIPCRRQYKPGSQKQANRAHARLRAPGERANAQLKAWRILRKLRCCPWHAGQLAKAIHTLKVHAE